MSVEKLSSELQHSILKLMITNDVFAANCFAYLQADYFENKYLYWSFDRIKKYYEKYGKIITFPVLKDLIKTITEEERPNYLKIIEKIESIDVKEDGYIKDEVTNFIQTSEFKKMHVKEAELFNSGNYDEAYSFVQNSIEKIRQIKFNEDSYVKESDIDTLLAMDTKSDVIPIGLPDIDEDLLGGIPRQSVCTIIGGWNVGKSIVMQNMSVNFAKNGFKVLYVYHEGRKRQIVTRFISCITGIPYNTIVAKDLTDDDLRKIDIAKRFVAQNIRIKEMRTVGVSVEDVVDYARLTMKEWKFDALVSDYGQKLTTKGKGLKEQRLIYAHIWNVLDLLSAELNIAVVSAAQLNREGYKLSRKQGEIIRSDNISEAAAISHISETILTLNKSIANDDENKLLICLDKNREGKNGLVVECNTNYRCIRAYDQRLGIKSLGYNYQKAGDEEK